MPDLPDGVLLGRRCGRAVGLALLGVVASAAVLDASAAQDPPGAVPSLTATETGVAGIVGVVPDDATARGGGRPAPANRPVQVRSWDEFTSRFADSGSVSPRSDQRDAEAFRHLQLAVRGFFANGGRRAWVVRVPTVSELTDPAEALRSLRRVDVDLVLLPGATARRQHEVALAHVESAGDRFAVLDAPPSGAATGRASFRRTPHNSDRATLLVPWLSVRDPVTGRPESQPPSGHVAGALARNDREQGLHRGPGNVPVVGALSPESTLSRTEMETLTRAGVLILRTPPESSDIVIWGGRTLGGDANGAYRYIAVRRSVDRVVETIDRGLAGLACADAVPAVEGFLQNMWREEALQGARPTEAYFVRCRSGSETLELGLAMSRPAEFVTVTVSLGG